MITKFIHQIQQAEKHLGLSHKEEPEMLPYKHYNKAWIRADKSISTIYTKSIKYSELQFYPNINYKAWGYWFLKHIKLKKSNRKLNLLLGFGFRSLFIKPDFLPVQADIIYYRYHTIIMVYTSLTPKRVIKIALTEWGKNIMMAEVKSQRLASLIHSKNVFIPSILNEVQDEYLYFSAEEYFKGNTSSFKNKSLLQSTYRVVFEFMLRFYLSQPIKLQYVSESEFVGHDFVEEFIEKQTSGIELLSVFKRLSAMKKAMILCMIHGDLSHNNILVNGKTVCIIDWGKSKHHYLFRDLDNSSFNTEHVFKQFIEQSQIDPNTVYLYYEQLFLNIFIEMCRLVHNGIKRKTIGPELYSWIEIQNKKLIEISKKF